MKYIIFIATFASLFSCTHKNKEANRAISSVMSKVVLSQGRLLAVKGSYDGEISRLTRFDESLSEEFIGNAINDAIKICEEDFDGTYFTRLPTEESYRDIVERDSYLKNGIYLKRHSSGCGGKVTLNPLKRSCHAGAVIYCMQE